MLFQEKSTHCWEAAVGPLKTPCPGTDSVSGPPDLGSVVASVMLAAVL